MSNISIKFINKEFTNPTVLASGFLGMSNASLRMVAKNGAGAVTAKSITLEPRAGHPNPTVLTFDKGMINAVGLANEGWDEAKEEIRNYLKNRPAPLLVSIAGSKASEYKELAAKVSMLKPDYIEVNISCPNVENEFGRPFACSVDDAAKVTKGVKEVSTVPVVIKLSPNVDDIGSIAKAVEDAGADAISAINTLGPGMLIDINTRKPIMANKVGGLSGPAVKPIALRCVYDIYKSVKVPIIGMGGVTTWEDAVAMMMAGATAVGIGTAIYYREVGVFREIAIGLEKYAREQGLKNISEIIGAAHE